MERRRGVRVTLPYIHSYRDRHGHQRYYFRRPGYPRATLPGKPGLPDFMDAYNRALSKEPPKPKRTIATAELGTVASAIGLYLGSAAFAGLAPDTRRTRRNELNRFRDQHGKNRLATLDKQNLERIALRRNLLKALSPWLDWCVSQKLIAANPSIGIKRPRSPNKEGYKTWPEEHIERFRAHHAIGSKARLALEVLVNVGSARVDTALLGRQHIRSGAIVYRRHKTKVLIEIPILPDLQRVIDELPLNGGLAFIAKDNGAAYTKESFGNMFRGWCREAGIPNGYSAHGIRKYAATVRADLGATVSQLMAWFGWLTEREAVEYTRSADRRRLAQQLGKMVNDQLATRDSGVSTPSVSAALDG
jgi:hypothetical protein